MGRTQNMGILQFGKKKGSGFMKYNLSPWFDAHVHLRGPDHPWCQQAFELIVGSVAKQCSYAVVMPNSPIIKTVEEMKAYREQILTAARKVAPDSDFQPLMTLYLTENSSEQDIKEAAEIPWFAGWKLYPQGVTTGSQEGVSDFRKLEKVLGMIDGVGSRLLIHGETTRPGISDLHTEDIFVMEDLPVIRQMFKGKICLEHCSTFSAINAVLDDDLMWGSITPHHLTRFAVDTRNPHNWCKPVWQTNYNRQYLIDNVFTFGSKFFAGTDTAPHLESQKLSADPPNGCFSAPVALPLYFKAVQEHYDGLPDSVRYASCEKNHYIRDRIEKFLYGSAAYFYDIVKDGQNILLGGNMHYGVNIVVEDNYLEPLLAPSGDDFKFSNGNLDGFDRIVPLRAGEKLRFSAHY